MIILTYTLEDSLFFQREKDTQIIKNYYSTKETSKSIFY